MMFKSTTASKKLRAQDSGVAKNMFIERVVTRSRKVQESTKASSPSALSADNIIKAPEWIASGYEPRFCFVNKAAGVRFGGAFAS